MMMEFMKIQFFLLATVHSVKTKIALTKQRAFCCNMYIYMYKMNMYNHTKVLAVK